VTGFNKKSKEKNFFKFSVTFFAFVRIMGVSKKQKHSGGVKKLPGIRKRR